MHSGIVAERTDSAQTSRTVSKENVAEITEADALALGGKYNANQVHYWVRRSPYILCAVKLMCGVAGPHTNGARKWNMVASNIAINKRNQPNVPTPRHVIPAV